ncbi:LLGL domain-containing protein l(2)gl [Dermatophagoides pteronyssinus]|uniref:LLGL domain-containing protein l(2)gl n=1 Tax=Dermatophagoides pteronyssinus TaxID=6956 RepID=UPI003F67BE81
MKFFLGKSSQHHHHHHQTASDRLKLYKDFYEFRKTVLHGFPANPSCLAFDQQNRLLAIGTKNGSLQIYGKLGVEFHYQFEDDDNDCQEIVQIFFISRLAAILCLCEDFSIHLLKIPTKSTNSDITKLYSNNFFVQNNDGDNDHHTNQQPSKIITSLALNEKQTILFIGLNNGDIQLMNIDDSLSLKDDSTIKLDEILKSIPEDLKLKPGSVEVIQEQPGQDGKILIGYNRSLIVLWNYQQKSLENYFHIEQHLEHLSWNNGNGGNDGFISCHNDGSYNVWSANQEQHDCKNFKLPYGPFPCKAIRKIFWNSSPSGEYIIFNGGMPRASYGDKETVSIIHNIDNNNGENSSSANERNIVLDFTSKIVDFLPIFSSTENKDDDHSSKLEALVVLAVEELVVIDLQHQDWPQFKLPYLSCLHSSPITYSQYYSNVNPDIFKQILDSGTNESNVKYSQNNWPINGGIAAISTSTGSSATLINDQQHNLLITGHEDGTVRFWDSSSTRSLKYLYTIHTSKLFNLNEDDILLENDGDDHNLSGGQDGEDDDDQIEWPPFRKVGQFDPYSDDPRLAIRKLTFCPEQGLLVIGGTAGQIILFDFNEKPLELRSEFIEIRIIDEKDSFIWKGHNCLPVRKSMIKFSSGYQPKNFIQIYPPAAITALVISTCWQVVSIGTAHGFTLFDYQKNLRLIVKSTLKPSNISSAMGGDALISRRKSFKKSLRESFRRLRRSRSQKSKRNIQKTNQQQSTGKIHEVNNRLMNNRTITEQIDHHSIKPVERAIEANVTNKSSDDMMSSMVRFFYFCSSPIISNNQLCPSFWVGTNAGTLFIYVLMNDKNASTTTTTSIRCWQLAKEVQLKHKAPIIFIRLIDSNGRPLSENILPSQQQQSIESNEKSISIPNRILICSEEQFKLFSLPNFKTIQKFKLTAHEGARVRKIDFGKFYHKQNSNLMEYSLMFLTNLGDVNVFQSWPDFRRKYQQQVLKKEDIHGICSFIFTNNGEGFYLKSSSEYQRFTLSARRSDQQECHIKLAEIQATNETNSNKISNSNITTDDDNDNNNRNLLKISPIKNQNNGGVGAISSSIDRNGTIVAAAVEENDPESTS